MFKAMQKAKAKKGFTLVELIVVISIIAILLLILIPSLLSYLDNARDTKGKANAKSAYNAGITVYTDEVAGGGSITDKDDLKTKVLAAGIIDTTWDVEYTVDASGKPTKATFTDGSNSYDWPE